MINSDSMELTVDYVGGAIGDDRKTLVCTDGTRYSVPVGCGIQAGAKLHPVSGFVDTYEGPVEARAATNGICGSGCRGCTLNELFRAISGRKVLEKMKSESMVN